MKSHTVASAAALALLFTAPALIAVDAVGGLGFVSPASAQPGPLSKQQAEALEAYNRAVDNFKQVLAQRRSGRGRRYVRAPLATAL